MSFSCYKVLWIIAHFLVDLLEAIYYFGLEFRENFYNFIQNITKIRHQKTGDERHLIENHLNDIKKLPKHLAVILSVNSKSDVDLKQLTNLILWSLSSGVNFISFYDYKGIIKHQLASSFYRTIAQVNRADSENIVWGPKYQNTSKDGVKFPHRNGYKRHIVVNLYSSDDGHAKFTELLTQELCRDKDASENSGNCNTKQITIDYIDEKLSKMFGHIPDPDLAVFFGSACCTSGFMPWQIRLTEFIPISYKLHNLSLDKYLQVLYKYAKCEQRFGK